MGQRRAFMDHPHNCNGVAMTDFANILFDSVARVRKAADTHGVCQAIVDFSARLGFDRVIVCSVSSRPTDDDIIDELFFVHGDWAEGRSAEERDAYLLHCPITRHILEMEEPFFWSKNPSSNAGRMNYRIVRGIRDLGEINGIQVPVFGRTGLEGAASFATETLDLSPSLKLAAQAFCSAAFFALRHHRYPGAHPVTPAMTEREREVLQWVALGKQQSEVAAILMISERTVENHLRSARKRLGAASTAHAVARAMRLGDIEI